MGKIFAITGLDREEFLVNLKCDPEKAIQLREEYPEVQPGYHMNKKHWNTIAFDENLPNQLLKDFIDHSYELVVNGLTRKQKRN